MSLKNTLAGIVEQVDGALSLVVMAADGIPVEEVTRDDQGRDLQLLMVEHASVLQEIRKMTALLEVGELEEVAIGFSSLKVVVRILDSELFVALVLLPAGNYGKGRYLLRIKGAEIARELS